MIIIFWIEIFFLVEFLAVQVIVWMMMTMVTM